MKKFCLFILLIVFSRSIDSYAAERVVLSSTKSFYDQVDVSKRGEKNAIYIIATVFDLKGLTVHVPENAVLSFEGGSISNGTLHGYASHIDAYPQQIFKDIVLSGTWTLKALEVEWFGAKPNRAKFDSSKAINDAIVSGKQINVPIHLNSGKYYTRNTIILSGVGLVGSGRDQSIICYDSSAKVGVFMKGYFRYIRDIGIHEKDTTRTGVCLKVGDINDKISSTRGYIEDVEVFGGDVGLSLEYQWCNKISGIMARFNNIGIYGGRTTPYIENAVIEDNFACGIVSDYDGFRLYNAIIEGNSVGAYFNCEEVSIINCYFECNQLMKGSNKKILRDHGIKVDGGHLFVGLEKTVTRCLLLGNFIDIYQRHNNRVVIDKCQLCTCYGNDSMNKAEITKNCKKYILDEK